MSNITTKTNRLSVANRKTIINNAVCDSVESVITAIREMGINNPIETENAWKIFCDESGTFHTQLLKDFLFENSSRGDKFTKNINHIFFIVKHFYLS